MIRDSVPGPYLDSLLERDVIRDMETRFVMRAIRFCDVIDVSNRQDMESSTKAMPP